MPTSETHSKGPNGCNNQFSRNSKINAETNPADAVMVNMPYKKLKPTPRWFRVIFAPFTEKLARMYELLGIIGFGFLSLALHTHQKWLRIVGEFLVAPMVIWLIVMFGLVLPPLAVYCLVERRRRRG